MSDAISYSARLGAIRSHQFQAALTRFDLGTFLRAAPITAGLFGQNVFVSSSAGEFVLRGAPHYDWQFPTERFFAQMLHERTSVPVPWPYLLVAQADIFGWPFVLMPRTPGVELSNCVARSRLTAADRRSIARALGENLASMHRLEWPEAGRYTFETDAIAPVEGGSNGMVLASIRLHLTNARSYNDRTSESDAVWVEEMIGAARPGLGQPLTPVCVHSDYKEGNLTVQREAVGWVVSGVLDLMECVLANGEIDLCRQLAAYMDEDAELAQAYVDAYLSRRPIRHGLAQRLSVYMLRDRLIIWEYFQRPGHRPYWPSNLTLREWASHYIDAIRTLTNR